MKELVITSPVFQNKEFIPAKYTRDGPNVNRPLSIEGIPEETQSLVSIVDDPDAPIRTRELAKGEIVGLCERR